ncbi:MAG: arsenate reductase ArsC [Candidatus Margulisiibacteriota bacterium]|jgi:arsenate reductase
MGSLKKILFVCIHNSARSQMAEAFLNQSGNANFQAESAGLEPGKLNPIVVKVMQEIGIDLSQKSTQSVYDLINAGKTYDYVITVCDGASGERCPMFPGKSVQRLHWEFADPSALTGTEEEKLVGTRIIRDQIKNQISEFIKEVKP